MRSFVVVFLLIFAGPLTAQTILNMPFEDRDQATTFGVNAMAGNWEWASNQALPISGSVGYVGVAIQGEMACSSATLGAVGSSNEFRASYGYRCAR